jgi:hypothetical protein
MRASVVACLHEASTEQVGSVTATWNTIVDEQLHNNLAASITTECNVFSNSTGRTVAEYSVSHRGSITAVVLDKTLGTNIIHMEFRGLSKLRIPDQRRHSHSCISKVIYRFLYGNSSLIGYYGNPAWLFIPITIEVCKPRLKLRDERCRVRSKGIGSIKDIFVDLCYVTGHSPSTPASATATATSTATAATCAYGGRVSVNARLVLYDSCRI